MTSTAFMFLNLKSKKIPAQMLISENKTAEIFYYFFFLNFKHLRPITLNLIVKTRKKDFSSGSKYNFSKVCRQLAGGGGGRVTDHCTFLVMSLLLPKTVTRAPADSWT
jgi:hypothetical protein